MENLERLADELQENCGAGVDESITESSIIFHAAAGGSAIRIGLYIITRDCLKKSVILMGVAAMGEYNSRDQASQATVLRATAVMYLITLNGVMDVKAERNYYAQDFETVPLHTPLHLTKLFTVDFVYLLFKHKNRIIHTLGD